MPHQLQQSIQNSLEQVQSSLAQLPTYGEHRMSSARLLMVKGHHVRCFRVFQVLEKFSSSCPPSPHATRETFTRQLLQRRVQT